MKISRLVSRHAQSTIQRRHPKERQAPNPWALYRLVRHGTFAKRRQGGQRHGR